MHYGPKEKSIMFTVRYQVWVRKTARKNASLCLKLKSLLSMTEAFCEHMKHAHNLAIEWRGALELEPPAFDPTKSGFHKEEASKTLSAITVPDATTLAPLEVLKMISCGCCSDEACVF